MEYVEQRPNGDFQWVHRPPWRRHDPRYEWVRNRHQRRNHSEHRNSTYGTGNSHRHQDHRQIGLPSFRDIERLIGIYVATGEGQGALLAAKVSEETGRRMSDHFYQDELDYMRRFNRRPPPPPPPYGYQPPRPPPPGPPPPPRPPGPPGPPPQRPPSRSSSSSSDDDQGPSGQPRPQGRPPSGPQPRPPIRPPEIRPPLGAYIDPYNEEYDGRWGRIPFYAPRPGLPLDDRVWIPLQEMRNEERRFLRINEFDYERRAEYQPDFARASYFDGYGPRPIVRPSPAHINPHAQHLEHENIPPPPRPPQMPGGPPQPVIIEVGGDPNERIRIEENQIRLDRQRRAEERLASRQYGHRFDIQVEGRERYHAHVSDASEDDEPVYADLPAEEDDFRIHALPDVETRQRSSAPRGGHSGQVRTGSYERVMPRSSIVIEGPIRLRGGDGTNHDPFDTSSESESQFFGHIRGGMGAIDMPTKTSAIGAGVLPRPKFVSDTEPRRIHLFFYYTSRGKIISSRKHETYTTFQEVGDPNAISNRDQLSDLWLVKKLKEHYNIINRRQQTILWDLISMRTIGFASFVRFERTVAPEQDANGYTVTAKIPAIVAKGEAVSQFRYLLKYPLKTSKMMLFNLDRLAATTRRNRSVFYVVEIKEVPDTRKIYILLIVLIFISTAGGVAYAVIQEDVSTGLSIATYVLTCLSLILALVAAGQWLGLSKPDSFSFAYSVEKNQVLGATNMQEIVGRNYMSGRDGPFTRLNND